MNPNSNDQDNNPLSAEPNSETTSTSSTSVTSNQVPSQPPQKKSNKKLMAVVGVLVLLLALVTALLLTVLMNKDDKGSDNASTKNDSSKSDDDSVEATVEAPKDIVTAPTANSDLTVTITGLNKSGNTMTVNYRLNHAGQDKNKDVYASALPAGIYVVQNKASTPEPYFIEDSTGQKFGLVKDEKGEPLATKSLSKYIGAGESISGYVTLSLPPNNSTVSLSLGDMPQIAGIKLKY